MLNAAMLRPSAATASPMAVTIHVRAGRNFFMVVIRRGCSSLSLYGGSRRVIRDSPRSLRRPGVVGERQQKRAACRRPIPGVYVSDPYNNSRPLEGHPVWWPVFVCHLSSLRGWCGDACIYVGAVGAEYRLVVDTVVFGFFDEHDR